MQIAADTNVLLDFAKQDDWVIQAVQILRGKVMGKIYLPPTVVQELAFAQQHSKPETQELAEIALDKLLEWGFEPFNLVGVGHGITDLISSELRIRGFLPEEEINDGLIIAECALSNINLLLTSDSHILAVQDDECGKSFREYLESKHVYPLLVTSPIAVVKSYGQ